MTTLNEHRARIDSTEPQSKQLLPAEASPQGDVSSEPPNVQISIRGMLLLMAFVSILIAIWMEFGAMVGLGTSFVVLLFGAHILGAMLGKNRPTEDIRRRESGLTAERVESRSSSADSIDATIQAEGSPPGSSSILARLLGAFIGATCFALLGGGALISAYSAQLNWWNGTVALGATAVVGGLVGFGVVNLLRVAVRFIVTLHDENSLT